MPRDVLHSQTSFSPHLSPHYPRILMPTLHNPRTQNSGAQTSFASQVLSEERTQMLHSAASQALSDLKILRPSENATEHNSWSKMPRRSMAKKNHLDSESEKLEHDQMSTRVSTAGNDQIRTRISTAENDQMSTSVYTPGNDPMRTRVSTAGNDQMSTRVSTAGNDQMRTRVSIPGNDQMRTRVSTLGNDLMRTLISTARNVQMSTSDSTSGNDQMRTRLSTAGNDQVSTPVSTPGNDQTRTRVSTAGNDKMSTRVSTAGNDQMSTMGHDPMFSYMGVSTKGNDPMCADASTSVSDRMSAGVSPSEAPGGVRVTPLQVKDLRLRDLDQEARKGSVIVTSRCQVATASSTGWMGWSHGQRTQARGARAGAQQDSCTQTLQSVGTQTSRHRHSRERAGAGPPDASACFTRRGAWEPLQLELQDASTQTQRDVRALWWKDKMTATVHEAETQTPSTTRRRILVLSDQEAQTEESGQRRDVGKSVSPQRVRRSVADDSAWRTLRPTAREARGRAHKTAARGVGGVP